jgi:hypothetical protein
MTGGLEKRRRSQSFDACLVETKKVKGVEIISQENPCQKEKTQLGKMTSLRIQVDWSRNVQNISVY